MRIEVDIPTPEDLLDESAKSRLRHDALEAAVLRLFDERRISSAEAAEDLGLTRVHGIDASPRHSVPRLHFRGSCGRRSWTRSQAICRLPARRGDGLVVVANSSPLIYLAALSDFELLPKLFSNVQIPPARCGRRLWNKTQDSRSRRPPAFPWDTALRYLLWDRDQIFGDDFTKQVRDLGIQEVLSAPRSPWQRALRRAHPSES